MIFGHPLFSLPYIYKLRNWAYSKCFNLGPGATLMEGVEFMRKHSLEGKLSVGRKVHFSRRVSVDFTGGVTLGNNVVLSEGAMIMSHSHDMLNLKVKTVRLTPVHIADGAWICVNAIIMPGVGYIGKESVISPGSVVYKRVPDYAIVRGNPAKVVSIMTPELRKAEQTHAEQNH